MTELSRLGAASTLQTRGMQRWSEQGRWLSRMIALGCLAGPLLAAQHVSASSAVVAEDDKPPAPAATPRYELRGNVLYARTLAGEVEVALPGPALALAVAGARAYVALGSLGAAIVSQNASGQVAVEKRIPVSHGTVTGFMVSGGDVWMQVSSENAILLGSDGAETVAVPQPVPVVTAPGAPVPAGGGALDPKAEGRASSVSSIEIQRIFGGKVLLNRGSDDGLAVGERLRVVRHEAGEDAAGRFEAEREVAVLVVESLGRHDARARIWRGDEVTAGDQVQVADDRAEPSLLYPRQLAEYVEMEASLRPILNVGDSGFGLLFDGNVTYQGEHLFLGVRSQPLGFGRTQESTVFTQTLLAEGGYNSRPFAIGVGLGFASVYGDLQELFELTSLDAPSTRSDESPWQDGDPEHSEWRQDMQNAFAVGQRVRLGASDGLHLSVANTLLYFGGADGRGSSDDPTSAGFIWGGTDARLTIPLALNADLFLEGGGGATGYAYGAVGVFGWLSGNGGAGSLGLFASAGGAGVWSARERDNYRYSYTESEDIAVGGPMISLGVRYRMGVSD